MHLSITRGTLSAYIPQDESLLRPDIACTLMQLHGKSLPALIQHRHCRRLLRDTLTTLPDDIQAESEIAITAIRSALDNFEHARAPIQPLTAQQRLAYLDEFNTITCKRDLRAPNAGPDAPILFRAGHTYPLDTKLAYTERTTERESVAGAIESLILSGRELVFLISDEDAITRQFRHDAARVNSALSQTTLKFQFTFSTTDLLEHFDIPEIPDLAERHKDRYNEYLEKLKAIEQSTGLAYKKFQLTDFATMALMDSGLNATDTGLGKTLLLFTYPLLKCSNAPVLITAPGDLFTQIANDGKEKFGITLTQLDKPTFLRLTENGTKPVVPGFYFASFTDLSRNHVDRIEDHERWPELSIVEHKIMSEGIGEARWYPSDSGSFRIRCVASPTLADLCATAFECVMIDEGTAMQGGDDTLVARGLLTLDPKYRCVCTATPIKNRLWSIFWLLWWAAGGRQHAHARFPYSSDKYQQDAFATDYLVTERNITREQAAAKSGRRQTHKRRTAEVCNLFGLWKFIAPLVLRRRKEDCGEKLVKKTFHYIHVPMSAYQSTLYRQALEEKSDTITKLQKLRAIAAEGSTGILPAPSTRARASKHLTLSPKTSAALNLIHQILARGEQFLVFNAFHGATDQLSALLKESEVKHVTLDGRLTPRKRGLVAQQLKNQSVPGALAGVNSMSLGHSFPLVNNVIVLSSTWSLDEMLQAVDRAYRINSVRDLNVYFIICDRSIETYMRADLAEKTNSSELVLDGELINKNVSELNPSDLLRYAQEAFYEGSATILPAPQNHANVSEHLTNSTAHSLTDWPTLKETIRATASTWRPNYGAGSIQTNPTQPKNPYPAPYWKRRLKSH